LKKRNDTDRFRGERRRGMMRFLESDEELKASSTNRNHCKPCQPRGVGKEQINSGSELLLFDRLRADTPFNGI